jgi:hypothetical protein
MYNLTGYLIIVAYLLACMYSAAPPTGSKASGLGITEEFINLLLDHDVPSPSNGRYGDLHCTFTLSGLQIGHGSKWWINRFHHGQLCLSD